MYASPIGWKPHYIAALLHDRMVPAKPKLLRTCKHNRSSGSRAPISIYLPAPISLHHTSYQQSTIMTRNTTNKTYFVIVRFKIFCNFVFGRETSCRHIRSQREGTVRFVAVGGWCHGVLLWLCKQQRRQQV